MGYVKFLLAAALAAAAHGVHLTLIRLQASRVETAFLPASLTNEAGLLNELLVKILSPGFVGLH